MAEKGEKPEFEFHGFDHVKFWVGNAKQAADWYKARLGFKEVAYKGLETGSRDFVSHVVQQDKILFEFISSLSPENAEFGKHNEKHGDGAKDVAFTVDDCRKVYARAIRGGAVSVVEPHVEKDDEGSVVLATIKTYGDTTHTLVERKDYMGAFLPGYKKVEDNDPLTTFAPPVGLGFIDHCVGNQPDEEMEKVAKFYEESLEFHRFWSVDEDVLHTEFSALRSIVMTDWHERVKMPINEPAPGKKKSQIQEYVEFYGGPGVQHIALNTPDIISAVSSLKARGTKFLTVPKTYYTALREKLSKSPVNVKEDLDKIEELDILVDYDDQGYLLQIFTQPVEDRPTLFYEIIQRNNHQGFGVGNFKALFEAIERAQDARGNL